MALKTVALVCGILALSAARLSAQSVVVQTAAELERVLALPSVSYGDAAWVVLNAAGAAADSANGAYRFAADNKWLPKRAAPDAPVTLGSLSLLIMKAFDIKGGFMYALFPDLRSATPTGNWRTGKL